MNRILFAASLIICAGATAGVRAGSFDSLGNAHTAMLKGITDNRALHMAGEGVSGISWRAPKAINQNSSWEEIQRSAEVHFPSISFGNIFVSATNICVDGANLRTKNAIALCVESRDDGYGSGGSEGGPSLHTCVRTAARVLSTPIHYTKRVCGWTPHTGSEGMQVPDCSNVQTVSGSHALSYSLQVRTPTVSGGSEGQDQPGYVLFTKNFTIPACN